MNFPHNLVLLKADSYQRDGGGHVAVDDAGWPIEVDEAPVIAFRGWLQPSPTPKRIRNIANPEILAEDDAGMAFTSHIVFAPMSLKGVALKRDRIRFDPPDGLEYLIANDPENAAGRNHHLEIDVVEYRFGTGAA